MLRSLARGCYERRRLVLVLWIVALFGLGFVGSRFGADTADDFELPDSESQVVFDILERKFSGFGDGARIVFSSKADLRQPAVRAEVEKLLADVAKDPLVGAVASPYQFGQGGLSPDGTIGFSTVRLKFRGPDIENEKILALRAQIESRPTATFDAYFGGQVARFAEREGPGGREGIGVLAAIVILLVTFGSVIAMGLPLITAIFGLGIGLSLIGLVAHFVDVPQFGPQLAAMIGLGVGIDYALFIVTRYRQTLHGGLEPEEAVVTALVTSGRAVIFAGITVVISLLGLFLIGLKFVQGMAVGASVTVTVVMVASVTLLPAILGFAGHAIDKLRVPRIHRDESDHRASVFYRWSRFVQRTPLRAGVAGTVLLLVLAIPLFSIDLGFTDEGNDAPGSGTRVAYDLLAKGFGPGFNGPLLLAAELSTPTSLAGFGDTLRAVRSDDGVSFVSPPFRSPDGDVAIAMVFPKTAPQDDATGRLIERLRGRVIPSVESDDAPTVYVGGITALFVDFADYLQGRLLWFVGAVLVLSFLLLLVVFRSVLIPLKAGIVNLLGIGAAYGVVVAIFQWGWLKDVFGVQRTGPIEAFLPMMLFAILFGLSMDYEVFLMSRIREEYLRTGRNAEAVADGLAATAGVITAAAAIMVTLFLSFVLGDDRVIKLFGLGLAVAIFLDATIIRMVVVPSFMELFGDANWWVPRWLDRLLPKVSVEAADVLTVPEAVVAAKSTSVRKVTQKKGAPRKPAARKATKPAARTGPRKAPARRAPARKTSAARGKARSTE